MLRKDSNTDYGEATDEKRCMKLLIITHVEEEINSSCTMEC